MYNTETDNYLSHDKVPRNNVMQPVEGKSNLVVIRGNTYDLNELDEALDLAFIKPTINPTDKLNELKMALFTALRKIKRILINNK